MRAKRIFKWALLVIAAGLVVYGGIIACVLWDFRERRVVLTAQSEQPLTEAQAIELSREALKRVEEDVTQFRPEPYDGTNLYARNALTPYSGYVLWSSTGSHPDFSVRLAQVGRDVHCGVGRCK